MQFTRQNNDMLVPFIKLAIEFNHGAWAISAAALNLGPNNATGVHNVGYFQQEIFCSMSF